MRIKQKLFQGFLAIAALAVVLCLASVFVGGAPEDDEAALRARVEQFWEYRLAGDGYSIYELMEPAIAEDYTQTEFTATQIHNIYYSYEILGIDIDGDRATVRIEYEWIMKIAALRSIRPKKDIIEDVWLRIDDTWYRRYREPHLPGIDRFRTPPRTETRNP